MRVNKNNLPFIEMETFLRDMGEKKPKKRTGKLRTPEEQKAARERWWAAESRRRENLKNASKRN